MKRFSVVAALLLAVTTDVFAAAANQLSVEEKAGGWKLLLEGTNTAAWRSFKKAGFPAKGWVAEDGWLHCQGKGGGDIITDGEFTDFELRWEWRLATNGNSGVKYFISESRNSPIGHEYQLIDDERNEDARLRDGRRLTGSLYDLIKPSGAAARPPLEINESRLVVKGSHVEHWLNGVKVLEYECGSEAMKKAVAGSKYKGTAGFGDKIPGHILLQDHHSDVWFRNLKIHEIQ